jgi:hypothetical protein
MSNNNETPVIPKKRGRKPKQVILSQNEPSTQTTDTENKDNAVIENINVIIEESNNKLTENSEPVTSNGDFFTSENTVDDENTIQHEENKPIAKKRGRKPKGGKIIQQVVPLNANKETRPNVILHLKCSLKDMYSNEYNNVEINGFDLTSSTQLKYDTITNEQSYNSSNLNNNLNNYISNDFQELNKSDDEYDAECTKEGDIREVWKKLKTLEHNLHINNICDKKSACFWCTYDFDNPPVYIPKHYIKESYHVYGCFCSPECATAYLMEENIDSSAKFERYYLINHIYSKIYDYKKNVKPAPNPFYMLEKYYGNLTIQEYRALLRNERLFLIVDKPLTRILPELHEDNDDFIINNKIIPSNAYQFKKKLQKKQNKNNILTERFGLLQP